MFNAAAVLRGGRLRGVYHKQYLPNYGVFDEARYFRPGGGVQLFEIAGAKVGVTICEDIWYSSGPMQDQCLAGAELIVNINGSPFHAGKSAQREQMLATRAADNAVATAYCNLVGGQDHLIFDGGSAVFGPAGQLLSRAELFQEQLLCVDIDIEAVRQVRLHDPRLRRLPQAEGRVTDVGAASEDARPPLKRQVAQPRPAVAAGLRSAGAGDARLCPQNRLRKGHHRALRRDRLNNHRSAGGRSAGRGARPRRLNALPLLLGGQRLGRPRPRRQPRHPAGHPAHRRLNAGDAGHARTRLRGAPPPM